MMEKHRLVARWVADRLCNYGLQFQQMIHQHTKHQNPTRQCYADALCMVLTEVHNTEHSPGPGSTKLIVRN